jgi:hypothetical protein
MHITRHQTREYKNVPTQMKDDHQASTTEGVQDLMIPLVRKGVNTSLSSLQVWADLARQVGPNVLGSSTNGTMVFRVGDYHVFKKLLAAQCKIVDELIAVQRELVQHYHALR